MRYYAEPRRTKCIFLLDFEDTPAISFANDYIHFALHHHGIQWNPYRFEQFSDEEQPPSMTQSQGIYTPNPLSYFSWNMLTATAYILGNRAALYESTYDQLVPEGTEDKLARFVLLVNYMLGELYRKYPSPYEVLFGLASVASFTVIFYQHGVKDAVNVAPGLISGFMSKLNSVCNGEAFYHLNRCAEKVISWFEEEEEDEDKGL